MQILALMCSPWFDLFRVWDSKLDASSNPYSTLMQAAVKISSTANWTQPAAVNYSGEMRLVQRGALLGEQEHRPGTR